MSAVKALYAVYNKNCGHTAYVANERVMAEHVIAHLTVAGRWGWRIKTDPTDDDIACLLEGRRCEVCVVDPDTADGFVLHIGGPGSAP